MSNSGDAIKERILDLLGSGVTQVQVAAACGIDESYISQLMEDEDFRQQVLDKRASRVIEHKETDDTIDRIEKKSLEKLEKLIQFETNIMRVLRVFQAANAAKKKTESNVPATGTAGTVVNISVPMTAVVQFKMTPDAQVVEVGDRSMVTMPAQVVNKKLQERKAERLLASDAVLMPTDAMKQLAKF